MERVDSITVYFEKFKEWLIKDSVFGVLSFVLKMIKENIKDLSEFKLKFNERFPNANSLIVLIAQFLFNFFAKLNKAFGFMRVAQRISGTESGKPQISKSAIKKSIPLSQVNQITIEDVIHSDVQLAISSKPVHVKFYNYNTDPEKFFKYVEADLRTLKDIKR